MQTIRRLTLATAALALAMPAHAQQSRVYGPGGQSLGTISRDSQGAETFRDSRGNTTGRSSTDSQGTTTFFDARGNITGRTTAPQH